MITLFIKELKGLILQYYALTAVAIYVILLGLLLWVLPQTDLYHYGFAAERYVFSFAYYLLIFILPVIGVSLISVEYERGTHRLLGSLPLSTRQILLTKLAAGNMILILLMITVFCSIWILNKMSLQSTEDYSQVVGSMIGFMAIGTVILAISMLISSVFRNSGISLILSILAAYLMYEGLELISQTNLLSDSFAYVISTLGLHYHADMLSRGMVSSSSLIYLCSLVIIFLLITEVVTDKMTFR